MDRNSKMTWIVLILLTLSILAGGCAQRAAQVTPSPAPTDETAEPSATPPNVSPTPAPATVTVAISPLSGPPGSEVRVTAGGFSPQTEVELGVGRKDSEYDVLTTARTDASGSLATTVAIPMEAETEEAWVVVAATGDGAAQAVSNVFQVTAPEYDPAVSISPTSGPPGTAVQVAAQGYPPSTAVEIGLGRENSEYDIVDTSETGDEGSLQADVAIPGYAEADERWIVVVTSVAGATTGAQVEAVSNVFEVTWPAAQATVDISPTTGPPGTRVDVVARGFPASAEVEIGVGRVNSEYDVVATAQTDSSGQVETEIAIPTFVEPEDQWVIVVASADGTVKAVSDLFRVTQDPTPSGNLFTRTTITLIAVGDNGQSGELIGCGDSAIPVEISIEPTIAPLTAALNKLLSIKTREYGQSGLYNALYRSNLALGDVEIVNREAVIRLTGTLMLGGVCDEPRVRAQLQETALQFSTVDSVSIFVNGTPLEELLTAVTPTPPSGSPFTRTNIYLIAIGDNGQSGELIGCGDSVVPVEVSIEPTIAPLTAALNKLLSIGTSEYGMVGYYNALYRSDLTLADIEIVNREAVIRLAGTLMLGGVCDEPRVRAQLQETALQFSTVDSVSIFINGTPLEEMLGEG